MADITITEIGLDNTLLLDAINKGKARFVSDCASYLQVRRRLGGGALVWGRVRALIVLGAACSFWL